MTILVGVLATEGAVIAADRAITFGTDARLHTIGDRAQKVFCVGDQMIVAGTGQVGMAQRFARVADEFSKHLNTAKKPAASTHPKNPSPQQQQVQALSLQIEMFQGQIRTLQDQLLRTSPSQQIAEQVVYQDQAKNGTYIGTALSQLMSMELGRTQAPKGQFGALAAYVAGGQPHLCEFAVNDFQPEQKNDGCWYTSMGSGQLLADPYLAFMRRTFWKSGRPNIEDAIFTAVWVIYHAIEAAPGLIGHPIDIAVLKKWDREKYTSKIVSDDEREEHLNTVRASDEHLIAFRAPREAPAIPTPPSLGAAGDSPKTASSD